MNPGPQSKSVKCRVCEKTVKSNHKRFLCDICKDLTHASCTGLTQINQVRACIPNNWTCSYRISSILPFLTERSIDFDSSIDETYNSSLVSISNSDVHLSELESRQKLLRVAHLNTQCMTSTFDNFRLTIETYPFDIFTLSETWLKDNKLLLQYVNIPGYITYSETEIT